MPDLTRLQATLRRIDGRSYPAYKQLKGRWRLGPLELLIDHVQGDPFAQPSRLRLRVQTGIGPETAAEVDRREAAEDWLLRRFGQVLGGTRRGSGRSGELRIYRPGPEILQRSAVLLQADGVAELRFLAGLPARGRRILGREALELLTTDIAQAARAVQGVAADPGLARHIASVLRQRALRRQLGAQGLVAFIADDAILPRASGVSQAPLDAAVPFVSPDALRVTLSGPQGPVSGMGVPEGVTLIVGGGFHGKSTLLDAIQRGHLDHVPGDGREGVVALPDTVKIRAEDGRQVSGVDIGSFLRELPGGRSTSPFWTEDASGSTSQAAAIAESIEAGASVLLMDEDTSATNLLVRDERMRRLIPREREPITPLVERVRALHRDEGLSTVLVIGGVGDYLGVADTVIAMVEWVPHEVTAQARAIGVAVAQAPDPYHHGAPRRVRPGSIRAQGKGRVRARDERRVDYGTQEIDLRAVEQVLDGAHAATLGHALRLLSQVAGRWAGERGPTVTALLDTLDAILDDEGLDALSPFTEPVGSLLRPRRHEVAAALNRLRTLEVSVDAQR